MTTSHDAPATRAAAIEAAGQALVERWDTPLWKDAPHTGTFINSLRAALALPANEPQAARTAEHDAPEAQQAAAHADFCVVVDPTGPDTPYAVWCGHSADWKHGESFAWDMCQQHINDAIDREVEHAGRWYVVKAYVAPQAALSARPESTESRDAAAEQASLKAVFEHLLDVAASWHPIEEAPRDGTHILIRHKDGIPSTCHWFDGAWHLSVNMMGEFSEWKWGEPTHWMILPPMAATKGERNG